MSFFFATEVVGAALVAMVVLWLYDLTAIEFFKNPSSNRVLRVRFLSAASALAIAGLYIATIIGSISGGLWIIAKLSSPNGLAQPSRATIAVLLFGGIAASAAIRRAITIGARHIAAGSSPQPKMETTDFAPNSGANMPWFAAMQYYALMLNRTYKVFLADTMISGAVVRGIVANPATISPTLEDQAYWANTLAATLYEKIDVTSPAFRKLSFNNFQIPWTDIRTVDYSPKRKWGMGNVPHSGKIYLRLRSGSSRELILLGTQNGEELKKRLLDLLAGSAKKG